MIKINIIAVGKPKEKYLIDAAAEYIKRLGAYCSLTVTEIPPCRVNESAGDAALRIAVEDEGDRILAKLPPRAFVIPMCIEGKQLSSEGLASLIAEKSVSGIDTVCFVIGGSYGLSDRVKEKGGLRLSMSEMTFPHQLARVMLLEQIYRAFKINEGGKYHK